MGLNLSDEQRAVVEAPFGSQRLLACPGSGKTATAVRRLAELRRRLGSSRAYAALLSYSNVAVNTFRSEYSAAVQHGELHSHRVMIATVDSFVASQVFLLHASRLMQCKRYPFLVGGREPFLAGHTLFNGTYPASIAQLRVKLHASGALHFVLQSTNGLATPVLPAVAVSAIDRLSRCGAYTYDTARYWAWRALTEEPRLAELVSRRYPHILVDEAQDVGSLHGAILQALRQAGSTVSLIGDPHQAIFEFADADGSFLSSYSGSLPGVSLTVNRRSVSSIVAVANGLTGLCTTSARDNPERVHGAYTFRYDPKQLEVVQPSFVSRLLSCGYPLCDAVILCRGRALVRNLMGHGSSSGQGATERLARAAVLRDAQKDLARAFECLIDAICRLLDAPPPSLRVDLLRDRHRSDIRNVRRVLWRFLRDPQEGLPSAKLRASSEWQPLLKARLHVVLASVCAVGALQCSPTWKHRVTVAGLTNSPLIDAPSQASVPERVATKSVHEVKGEGIAAVLYLARKTDLESLLNGPSTEEGRIGYVAVTRARDLFLLGVPKGYDGFDRRLEAIGIKEWPMQPNLDSLP